MGYSNNQLQKKVPIMKNFENKGIHGLAIKVLKNSNRPMKVEDITERIMKFRKIGGKTPNNSVSYCLQHSKYARRVYNGFYEYKP